MTPEQLLVALAARGLPGAPPIDCDEPLDEPSWRWLHAEVDRHRLTGLLALAIADGVVPVTEIQDQRGRRAASSPWPPMRLPRAAVVGIVAHSTGPTSPTGC